MDPGLGKAGARLRKALALIDTEAITAMASCEAFEAELKAYGEKEAKHWKAKASLARARQLVKDLAKAKRNLLLRLTAVLCCYAPAEAPSFVLAELRGMGAGKAALVLGKSERDVEKDCGKVEALIGAGKDGCLNGKEEAECVGSWDADSVAKARGLLLGRSREALCEAADEVVGEAGKGGLGLPERG